MSTTTEIHEGMMFWFEGEDWRIIGAPTADEIAEGCRVWAVPVASPDTDRWFSLAEIADPHWTDDYGDN